MGVLIVRTDMLSEGKDRTRQFVSILSDGIKAVDSADDRLLRAKVSAFFRGSRPSRKSFFPKWPSRALMTTESFLRQTRMTRSSRAAQCGLIFSSRQGSTRR